MPEYDLDGATIGEKLATLDLINRDNEKNDTQEQTLSMVPPSADSVHILLKQALRADDNVSLLTCLYNRDEKVFFSVPKLVKTSILCWLCYPSNLKPTAYLLSLVIEFSPSSQTLKDRVSISFVDFIFGKVKNHMYTVI